MSDKSLGSLIFALGLISAIMYLYWLFFPADPSDPLFFSQWANARWALVIPILSVVLIVLIIAMWIGWTMIVTPPPPTMLTETSQETVKNGKKEER